MKALRYDMKKNGLAEWNTLNEEQRTFISVFFNGVCSGKRCLTLGCRNSPFDIMKCPTFKKWRSQVVINKVKEQKEYSLNDYLEELKKIEQGR